MENETITFATREGFFMVEDISILITAIIFSAAFILIVTYVINFIPSLMSSIIKKIKNDSIIYSDNTIHDPNLDKTTLGIKTMIDKVID
jgi:hypothetical protein